MDTNTHTVYTNVFPDFCIKRKHLADISLCNTKNGNFMDENKFRPWCKRAEKHFLITVMQRKFEMHFTLMSQ